MFFGLIGLIALPVLEPPIEKFAGKQSAAEACSVPASSLGGAVFRLGRNGSIYMDIIGAEVPKKNNDRYQQN